MVCLLPQGHVFVRISLVRQYDGGYFEKTRLKMLFSLKTTNRIDMTDKLIGLNDIYKLQNKWLIKVKQLGHCFCYQTKTQENAP